MPTRNGRATVPSGPTAPTDSNVSRDLTRPQRFASAADFLASLPPHDGQPRLATAATTHLRAIPSRFSHRPESVDELLRDFMLFAVGRALAPGCPSGGLLILEGPTGRLPMLMLWDPGSLAGCRHPLTGIGYWWRDSAEGPLMAFGCGPNNAWLVGLTDLGQEVNTVPMSSSAAAWGFLNRARCAKYGPVGYCLYSTAAAIRRGWTAEILKLDCVASISVPDPDLRLIRADRDQLWAEALRLYSEGRRWREFPEDIHG